LIEKGISVSLAQLSGDIAERDRRDAERAVSPLKPADDAVLLDTSTLNALDVEKVVRNLVCERGLARTAS
jgi:cytidylate kinase